MTLTTLRHALALSAAPLALAIAAQPASAQAAAEVTPPGDPVKGVVPLTVYSQLPGMTNPRLSPDGKHAVVTVASKGDRAYAVIDVTGSGAAPMLIATAGDFKNDGDRQIAGYRWVGDKNVLLTVRSMEDLGYGRAEVHRLVNYNLDDRKLVPVAWDNAAQNGGQVLHIDDSKGEVLISRTSRAYGTERRYNPEVVRVNVRTGKIVDFVERPNPVVDGWAADGNGVVRMGFGYDPRSGKQRMLYGSKAGDTLRTVSNEADKDFTGDGIKPQVFLDEPDMAIVTSNESGFSRVYKANLATMTLGEPLFEMAGYDVNGAIPNEDENGVLGYGYTDDRYRVKYTSPVHAQIQQFLDESFGDGNSRIASTNDGDTRLIVHVGAPNQPGIYYLYDVPTGQFSRMGFVNETIKDGKLNPVSAMTFRSSDGRTIQSIVTMPRNRLGQKNLPVVALVHGGPYGVRDDVSYDFWAQAVAEQGYVVVQPNYRGSGGFGRDFVKIGRDEGFGFRMQADVNEAVDALAAQGTVDPNRACIMGWSYGGYAAARGAERDASRWRCSVAGAGVYDMPAMKQYDRDNAGKAGSEYLSAGASDIRAISPALNTNKPWAPILVFHGVRDPRVPINQARTLVSNLKSSGKKEGTDFAYIEQPKNGHYSVYFTEAENLEWLRGATDWFARFNPAYVAGETRPTG